MEKKEILDNQKSDPRPVGRWIIYIDKCTGCGECVDACKVRLLKIVDKRIVITSQTTCNWCGDCADACASDAIVLT